MHNSTCPRKQTRTLFEKSMELSPGAATRAAVGSQGPLWAHRGRCGLTGAAVGSQGPNQNFLVDFNKIGPTYIYIFLQFIEYHSKLRVTVG